MDMKLVGVSILALSSITVFAQAADMQFDKSSPQLYRCSVKPAPLEHAANTKGTGMSSGRTAAGAMLAKWDRLDLEFTMIPPASGQTFPTIIGHAINTKVIGQNSGRMSGSPDAIASVSCAGAVPAPSRPSERRAKTTEATMNIRGIHPTNQNEGMSCSVSGTVERPLFEIGIWTGEAASDLAGRHEFKGTKIENLRSAEWSWGVSNSGSTKRVSIVPHSMPVLAKGRRNGSIVFYDPNDKEVFRTACTSETSGLRMKYDLATPKT